MLTEEGGRVPAEQAGGGGRLHGNATAGKEQGLFTLVAGQPCAEHTGRQMIGHVKSLPTVWWWQERIERSCPSKSVRLGPGSEHSAPSQQTRGEWDSHLCEPPARPPQAPGGSPLYTQGSVLREQLLSWGQQALGCL